MLYFFGTQPQGTLFEPVSPTSFKFDGYTLALTAQDMTNLQTFAADLRHEIEVMGRYEMRDLMLEDTTNHLRLCLCARYNALMHMELINTNNDERISPYYCAASDIALVEALESLNLNLFEA